MQLTHADAMNSQGKMCQRLMITTFHAQGIDSYSIEFTPFTPLASYFISEELQSSGNSWS
jgi:hypothetical protein